MEVPILDGFLIFLSYQVLTIGSINGLPFASISSISSLKSTTETTSEKLILADLRNTDSSTETVTNSINLKLYLSPPTDPNINSLSSPNAPAMKSENFTNNLVTLAATDASNPEPSPIISLSADICKSTSLTLDLTSLTSKDLSFNLNPSPETSSMSPGLKIIPNLKVDFDRTNTKRDSRDTGIVAKQNYFSNAESSGEYLKSSITDLSTSNKLPESTKFINNPSSLMFSSNLGSKLFVSSLPFNVSRPAMTNSLNNIGYLSQTSPSSSNCLLSTQLQHSTSNNQACSPPKTMSFYSPQQNNLSNIRPQIKLISSSGKSNTNFDTVKLLSSSDTDNSLSSNLVRSQNDFPVSPASETSSQFQRIILREAVSPNSAPDSCSTFSQGVSVDKEPSQNSVNVNSDMRQISEPLFVNPNVFQDRPRVKLNILPNSNDYIKQSGSNLVKIQDVQKNNNLNNVNNVNQCNFLNNQPSEQAINLNNNSPNGNQNVMNLDNPIILRTANNKETPPTTNHVNKLVSMTLRKTPQKSTANQNNNQGCPELQMISPKNNNDRTTNINLNSNPSFDLRLKQLRNNIERFKVANPDAKLVNSNSLMNTTNIIPLQSTDYNQLGYPQLTSIPIYRKDVVLKNTPADSTERLRNINVIAQTSQNNQGCSQNIPVTQNNNVAQQREVTSNQGQFSLSSVTANNNLIKMENNKQIDDQSNNLGCPRITPTNNFNIVNQQSDNMALRLLNNNRNLNTGENAIANSFSSCQNNINKQNNFIGQSRITTQVNNNLASILLNKIKNNNAPKITNNDDLNCQKDSPLSSNLVKTQYDFALKQNTPTNMIPNTSQNSNLLPTSDPSSFSISSASLSNGSQNSAKGNQFLSVESVSVPLSINTLNPLSNNLHALQDIASKKLASLSISNPVQSCLIPSQTKTEYPTNIISSPMRTSLNTVSSGISNVGSTIASNPLLQMTPSLTNIAVPKYVTNTQTPFTSQPLNYNPSNNNLDVSVFARNNVITPTPVLNTVNNSPLKSNFISVQSLPQVSFMNYVPSSTISVSTVETVLPENVISSISNLPIVQTSILPCSSIQSFQPPPTCSIIPSYTPQSNFVASGSTLNTLANSLAQNILSTLLSKNLQPSTTTVAEVPAVDSSPVTCTESSDDESTEYYDVLELEPVTSYLITPPSCLPHLSLPEIPVACNEYLPPLTQSFITAPFNAELFSPSSDSDIFDFCNPYALSDTDAFYPEVSFLTPATSAPIFYTASSVAPECKVSKQQSSSVTKINNAGREAKKLESLINSITYDG